MRPVLRVLAWGKHLRGSVLDPFGHTQERRTERQLIQDYLTLLGKVLPCATANNTQLVGELLSLPLSMRGFGHVKARHVQAAQARQAWLLHRLDPARHPRPQDTHGTQQLRGIVVRSDRESEQTLGQRDGAGLQRKRAGA